MSRRRLAFWLIYAGCVVAAVELAGVLADLLDSPVRDEGARTVGQLLFIPIAGLLMLASWHMLRGVFRTKG